MKIASSIRTIDWLRVYWRSFFIQSMWNYRGLIGAGFGMCLLGIAKRLYLEKSDQAVFLERQMTYFNAHPYFASYALGITIHLEEAHSKGDDKALAQLEKLKKRMVGLLGAIGDRLFWFTIKPAALAGATAACVLVDDLHLKVIGLIGAFLLFNIPHFYIRYLGLKEGYESGVNVHKKLNSERFALIQKIYWIILGLSLTIVLLAQLFELYKNVPESAIVFSIVIAGVFFLQKWLKNFYIIICSMLALAIVFGAVFINL